MKMIQNQVVRVKKYETRPDGWNYEGAMDEYMGKLVQIEYPILYIRCKPLFIPQHPFYKWTFSSDNFTKANTLVK
jgi:hypothetical protein